jgi:hypothetical protein
MFNLFNTFEYLGEAFVLCDYQNDLFVHSTLMFNFGSLSLLKPDLTVDRQPDRHANTRDKEMKGCGLGGRTVEVTHPAKACSQGRVLPELEPYLLV